VAIVKGVWTSNQKNIQPFRGDSFAFTTQTAGEIQFRVTLSDFCSEAQELLAGSNSKYLFKSGFFWHQR
jgi:hypothetical protein